MTRKAHALFATAVLSAAMLAVPNTASAASAPDPLPVLEMDMRNTPPGASTTSSITIPAGEYAQPDGRTLRLAAEERYQCTGQTNNPHWSRGNGGVIAKTVVSCSGPNGNIPVRVLSLLGRTEQNNIGTLQIVAESNYVQSVSVGALAKPETWYVPEKGAPQIRGDAYFRASHSVAGSPPLNTEIMGSGMSNFVYAKNG